LAKYILSAVIKLSKAIALPILVFWGLAAMHCNLEALTGFGFLQSCCFVDSAPTSPNDCEHDGCSAVENGCYRAEEGTTSAPLPLLFLAPVFSIIEAPLPELIGTSLVASQPPPELPKVWQFFYRTALPPRAPSIAS